MVKLSVTITPELYEQLRAIAGNYGCRMEMITRIALEMYAADMAKLPKLTPTTQELEDVDSALDRVLRDVARSEQQKNWAFLKTCPIE